MNIEGTPDNYTITLNGRELAALARFASKDTARQNLHGIGVYRGETGIRLAATDGHRMCVASQECELGAAKPILLGCKVATLATMVGARGSIAIIVGPTSAYADVTCANGLTAQHTFTLDGTPPPIDAVLPKASRTADVPDGGIGINPRYFADLSAVIMASDGDKDACLRLSFGEALDPILCDPCTPAEDGTTWQAIIMPMRV